uniref:Uncharacterized protein n=1 Tax=Arundo donax TaxID=35708 RepID=A0A0A8YTS9_ARUDO
MTLHALTVLVVTKIFEPGL